jgi:hypothetical protein
MMVRPRVRHPADHLGHARPDFARRLVARRTFRVERTGHEDHPPIRHRPENGPQHGTPIGARRRRDHGADLVRERPTERADRPHERLARSVRGENQPIVLPDVVGVSQRMMRTSARLGRASAVGRR